MDHCHKVDWVSRRQVEHALPPILAESPALLFEGQRDPTHADVIALYLSCPAVSQIWALTVLESTLMDLVANSTPMVDLDSRLNSLRVNLESTVEE